MLALTQAPEIIGDAPTPGVSCSSFKVFHFYEDGQITDPAIVTHFCLDGVWFRVCFQFDIVFWRSGQAPGIPTNSDFQSGTVLNDLSDENRIVGKTLQSIEHKLDETLTTVVTHWSGGAILRLEHSRKHGYTTLVVES